MLLLAWLTTENTATEVFTRFDMNRVVTLFSMSVNLLVWGVCVAVQHRGLPRLSTAARGPAVPGLFPPPEEQALAQPWPLLFPLYFISSFGILFVFS